MVDREALDYQPKKQSLSDTERNNFILELEQRTRLDESPVAYLKGLLRTFQWEPTLVEIRRRQKSGARQKLLLDLSAKLESDNYVDEHGIRKPLKERKKDSIKNEMTRLNSAEDQFRTTLEFN